MLRTFPITLPGKSGKNYALIKNIQWTEPTNACRLCKRQYSAHFCCGIFQLFVHNICNSAVSFTEQSKCTCFGRFKIMSTIYLISTGASYVTLKRNSKEDLLKLTACSYQSKLEVIESLYVYPSKIALNEQNSGVTLKEAGWSPIYHFQSLTMIFFTMYYYWEYQKYSE